MVNVAIAGGNGPIGRTILETLLKSGAHQALILSRKAFTDHSTARSVQVDYNEVESIVEVMEVHNIHTVICAFGVNGDSLRVSQMNLIKAAAKSSTTKRFVPTGFAINYPREGVDILPPLQHHFDCLAALEASTLEWTLFINGILLDYYGMPHIRSRLPTNVIVIDMNHNMAAIPGSGDVLVTFTYSYDLARFVVASLDLPKWPKESRIDGDTITWNQFVEAAQEVKGQKFTVTYDSVEKLKRFEVTELPGHRENYDRFPKERLQWFLSIFEFWTTDSTSCVLRDGSLNEKFPQIQTLTVRAMLEKYWKP